MELTIMPLKKAFASLIEAMKEAEKNPNNLVIRDGCIQRFEYTYELGIKLVKRYIEQANPITEKVDQMNFRDLIRLAAEMGLIDEVESWFKFRSARNITSHAYDEDKAKKIFQLIPVFIQKMQFLVSELDQRLNTNA